MRFFLVSDGKRVGESTFLQEACKKLEVEFVEINPSSFDFTKNLKVNNDDLLYRNSTNLDSKMLEGYLLGSGLPFITFFKSNFDIRSGISSIIHERFQLPVPKTVYRTTLNKEILKKDVEFLKGFPIIIKVVGGTGGVGVIKVETFEGLLSTLEYLKSSQKRVILREYINYQIYGRLVVVGDKVVASKQNEIPKDDFRANEGTPLVREFSSEVQSIAVKAVQVMGKEFGGVDILIDKEGNPYLTEVNMPCNFYNTQMTTGVDIAYFMVEHLKNKARDQKNF